jgi:predicted ATPase/class 3 adenylate cyclase/GAF domain-containing protein/tRNA A-37 threonylcarbamoyl transferase component Bud32
MLTLPGYEIFTEIHESFASIVYEGRRIQSEEPLIFKVLKDEYPTPEALARYKLEYEITRNLNLEGIPKTFGLVKYRNTLVIILENCGGKSLNFFIKHNTLTLEEFLSLAIKIVEIVGAIHAANIIHKDINPSNIIFNPATGQVKIIDFGISTVLSRENPTLCNPNVLEGTLAYMSPEQTGRMNRVIDYRTDFYSLGATFYELLTHQLPFETTDALELVHSHLAKQPLLPHQINPEIPQTISDIVIKLLAKTSEERYQSAWGIKADLEECLTQLRTTGKIYSFPLAQHDISDKFQISQKLYGREREVSTLLTAFERVASSTGTNLVDNSKEQQTAFQQDSPSDNPQSKIQSTKHTKQGEGSKSKIEMMLVSGYSGIGKSALVQEIYKPITRQRGYFISGKFDQYQRNIPYSALIKAFQELVKQLLTESETQLELWREKLNAIFGMNGQVIIDVIPEVELIVGKQSEVLPLSPTESQNRFNLVFQNFIQMFAQPEHPLVIFLDDLQWADEASLKLMQLLMTAGDSEYLFFIGSYRDNEVSPSHPLMLTINEIGKTGTIINYISLSPLDLSAINQLISDTLNCALERTKSLAELVLTKTNGNPFFINEFLKTLYTERLLEFDFAKGGWQWSIEKIQAQQITDNVVELMALKIQTLQATAQQMLQLAACIGNQFDLRTLAIVSEQSPRETALGLRDALVEGLVLPLSNAYKSVEFDESSVEDELTVEYKFTHDRIQQAAYSLIPSPQKQVIHQQIGDLLLKNTPESKQEEKIFDIVNQLNFGIESITNSSERNELARLNLIGGKKAKTSAAYASAFKYLTFGLELLSEDSWQNQYNLTLELYVESAISAYLSTNFEEMEQLASVVLQRARTVLDRVRVYEVKIQAYTVQNKQMEALRTALEVLKLLGMHFPERPKKFHSLLGLLKTKLILAGKPIESLIDLPEMTDPDKLAAMRILSSVAGTAAHIFPEMLPLILFKLVNLSVKYGNTSFSAFAYATYGFVLCSLAGDIEDGYRFGKLALSVLDKFNAKELKAKTFNIVYFLVRHWKEHIRETLQPLLEAYASGIETGDLEYGTYCAVMYCCHSYWSGKELVELVQQMTAYKYMIVQFKQNVTLSFNEVYRQTLLNLMGSGAENPCDLKGEAYDESKMLPLLHQAHDRSGICLFHLHKLVLCYLFENYDEALKNSTEVEKYFDSVAGWVVVPFFYLYDSLSRLAVYSTAHPSEQKRLLVKVDANQKKMKKWAHHAPINHLHKFYLVEAERLRVLGHDAKAIDFYNRAIKLAKEHEYLNEEALAYELTAKFYRAKGIDLMAKTYLTEARYCYIKWGAKTKVKDLEKKYSQLLSRTSEESREGTLSTHRSTSGSGSSDALDLATVMKASQALSREIVLDKLLANLMKILIENAGAQKGFLILESKGKLVIEASGSVAADSVTVLQSIPIQSKGSSQELFLATGIIYYVARTKKTVVLQDATREGQFTQDAYIKEYQPKSILCVPLINQGKLISIVYLENNLSTGAFTPDRVEVLQLLSSQAAIAIENAKLYNEVLQLNVAYERFVPKQFLQFLHKESIIDVQLGDQVQQEMSVLFSDIRSFTTLSESMTPEDNFKFINAYLSRMEPAIIEHQGFIDKYIGDAIMALFANSADDAVKAGIAMLHRLNEYNQHRTKTGYPPIQIGIGINTGALMLGTVGGYSRMDSTVISDAVNIASRIESLTKEYGVSMLISHQTFFHLQNSVQYAIRLIDRVKVKGKSETVSVFEVFDGDPPKLRDGKLATIKLFEEALVLYNLKNWDEAEQLFQQCLRQNPGDRVAQIYVERCQVSNRTSR